MTFIHLYGVLTPVTGPWRLCTVLYEVPAQLGRTVEGVTAPSPAPGDQTESQIRLQKYVNATFRPWHKPRVFVIKTGTH